MNIPPSERLENLLCSNLLLKVDLKELCERNHMPKSGNLSDLRNSLVNACFSGKLTVRKVLAGVKRDALDAYAKEYMSNYLSNPAELKVKALREAIEKFILENGEIKNPGQVATRNQQLQVEERKEMQAPSVYANPQILTPIMISAAEALTQFEFCMKNDVMKLGQFLFPECKIEAREAVTGEHYAYAGSQECVQLLYTIVSSGYQINRQNFDVGVEETSGIMRIDSWGGVMKQQNPYGEYRMRMLLGQHPETSNYYIFQIELALGVMPNMSMFQ
jgi:hypothetical protein